MAAVPVPEMDIDSILDSALDEFDREEQAAPANPAPLPPPPAEATAPSSAAAPAAGAPDLAALLSALSSPSAEPDSAQLEEFGRALAALGADPDAGGDDALKQLTALAAMLEKAAGADAASVPAPAPAPAPASVPLVIPGDFESSTDAALRMMSGGTASSSALAPTPEGSELDEFFNKVLGSMAQSGEDPDAMVERLVAQMLGREYLHQPMLEIARSYGPWISERRDRLTAEELANYEGQHRCFQRIVAVYEEKRPTGEESKAVMELMNEMQAFGQPPPELVSDLLPPEALAMATGSRAPPQLDDADLENLAKTGCPMQ